VSEGTPRALKAAVGVGTLDVQLAQPGRRDDARRILSRALGVPVHDAADPIALWARVLDAEGVGAALAELHAAGISVSGFALGQPSLDEVFLALTGASPRPSTTTITSQELA
jgi:ABC-2 type transport system ATP-binding protein